MQKSFKNDQRSESKQTNKKNSAKEETVDIGENDDEYEEYEEQIIELINDEGKIEKLVLEATFHLDDDQYAILREKGSDEGMVYRIDKTKNGEPVFSMIEDEEELNEVIEIYEAMADELI